jgi:hypothetical protein
MAGLDPAIHRTGRPGESPAFCLSNWEARIGTRSTLAVSRLRHKSAHAPMIVALG